MGCVCMKLAKKPHGDDDRITVLAAETAFTVSEVQALRELFRKLSSSITGDGLINKIQSAGSINTLPTLQMTGSFSVCIKQWQEESFCRQDAVLHNVFALFDLKHNGVIDFEEFVRSLSVFHPNAPESEKITCKKANLIMMIVSQSLPLSTVKTIHCSEYGGKKKFLAVAFRLYDLRDAGYIERSELVILFRMVETIQEVAILFGMVKTTREVAILFRMVKTIQEVAILFSMVKTTQEVAILFSMLKEMLLAHLSELDLSLSDDVVEAMVEKAFREADSKGDGRIDLDEWKEFVKQNPTLLKNMTLPYLK
ncbi:calcineurin b-like protein [Asimina triloba]